MVPLLILNYHRITRPGESIDPRYRNFTLDETVFRRQLETIRDLGIPVVNLKDRPATSDAPLQIAFTFDDGHLSDLTIAAELLSAFRFTAAFFPVIEHIGRPGYLDWEQLKLLQERGFAIGSHSLTHPVLTRFGPLALALEIRGAKDLIEEHLATTADLFSIPYGRYSPAVLDAIRGAGHLHALSTDPGINRGAPFLLKRWNIKASMTPEAFRSILTGKRKYLRCRRVTVSARHTYHRITDTFSKP